MSKNSLETLIGEYSSDSENDEATNAQDKTTTSLKPVKGQLPSTHWTQCNDPKTGHPYYWNVETKEVTWEIPQEYEQYLRKLSKLFTTIPDDCWIRGYSQAMHAPYYVNEYTRIVSWVKPKNYKQPDQVLPAGDKSGKSSTSREAILQSKRLKKAKEKLRRLPPHLIQPSDDEKLELITSYSKSESSSDEDGRRSKKKEGSAATSRNLVAAYDVSDSEQEEEDSRSCDSLNPKNAKREEVGRTMEDDEAVISSSKQSLNTSAAQGNTFSDIIVGGVSKSTIDEEIMRLKQELEQDLQSFDNASQPAKSPENECRFDEKTFQRKKRIQFKTSGERSEQPSRTTDNNSPKQGSNGNSGTQEKDKSNLYKYFQRSHVEFANQRDSDTEAAQGSGEENSKDSNECTKSTSEIAALSDLIAGKVKFLAVGHPDVSAVQSMNIQLETLLAAFHGSALDSEYFFKWLKTTSDDLSNLEQNACPDGWKCRWDRDNLQYCYENLSTGEIQWEFPEDKSKKDSPQNKEGAAGGEDEMDISTTPPPNENEQLKVENEVPPWDECNPPPPPIISAPSPKLRGELASFYSDIATLESGSSGAQDESQNSLQILDENGKKRAIDDIAAKKKRKKVKVHGLSLQMKDVSNMVANWKKAQRELDN